MKVKRQIELPDGWMKIDRETVVNSDIRARITLKSPRADFHYNERKFLLYMRGEWVLQYEVTGKGNWIAEFNTLMDAIQYAEKRGKNEM